MKYSSANPEHTIGAEVGNRYAVRARRGSSLRRPGAATAAEPSRKPRDAAELLAKIDALYKELSLQPLPKTRKPEPPPLLENAKSTGLVYLVVLVVALTLGEIWLYFDRPIELKREVPAAAPVVVAKSEVPPAPPPVVTPAPAPEAPPALSSAAPSEKPAKLQNARTAARKKAEQKRKAALEATRRAQEAEEQARKAHTEESKRTEALMAADLPPRPRGPSSPAELCADRGNFFSRNYCEAQACQQPEWREHPACVQRRTEQQRNQFPLSGGG